MQLSLSACSGAIPQLGGDAAHELVQIPRLDLEPVEYERV
jgi:hypothetical protein